LLAPTRKYDTLMNNISGFIPNISIPGIGTAFIPGIGTKNLGIPAEIGLEKISNEEKLQIIIRRLAYRHNPAINANPSISTVFGQPDFLPFPFLALGVRKGAAVCRLIREFSSDESAKSFINTIEQAEANRGQPFSLSNLAEICCVDIDIAQKIFEVTNTDQGRILLKPEYFSKKLKRIPVATAFLVGRNMLLTNYHVFPRNALEQEVSESINSISKEIIENEFIAQFNYEQDLLGNETFPVEYRCQNIIAEDKSLDFVLVKLRSNPEGDQYKNVGQAGDQFGWLSLAGDDATIAPPLPVINGFESQLTQENQLSDLELESLLGELIKKIDPVFLDKLKDFNDSSSAALLASLKKNALFGDPVNIIQHPKGRRKEIVLSNNRVTGIFKNFILYEADADFSSSGSPVMNQQWQLVSMHCGVLFKESQNALDQKVSDMEIGVRTCQIVDRLVSRLIEQVPQYNSSDKRAEIRELWLFVKGFVQLQEVQSKMIPILQGFEDIDINYHAPTASKLESLSFY